MKRKGYYLCSLLVMIFVFLSCRDEEQDCTQAMQDIQNQLKENDLLKSVSQEREQCVLLFESNKIIFPQELIQSVDVDAENWKTTIKLRYRSFCSPRERHTSHTGWTGSPVRITIRLFLYP